MKYFSKCWEGSEGEIKCAMRHIKACWKILFWTLGITQEEILGISTTQIHFVFNDMGQNSLICSSYSFGKKWLVDEDIFSEMFFSCFGYWHVALGNF